MNEITRITLEIINEYLTRIIKIADKTDDYATLSYIKVMCSNLSLDCSDRTLNKKYKRYHDD